LAERTGLLVVEVRALGGAIATVGQMVTWHLNPVRKIPGIGPYMSRWITASLSWAVLKLDRLSSIHGGGAMKDTLNWLMVAKKAEA